LLSCVAEDRPDFHARVDTLVRSARALGGTLASAPVVVNVVDRADREFVARMAELDVEVRIVARITDGGAAHANKLRMLELHKREDFDLLLAVDCDIAVAEDPTPLLSVEAISVVAADLDAFTTGQWAEIFDGLGLVRPERSVTATTSGQPMYPYFNSGVIGVPRARCADLLLAWVAALKDLDRLWRLRPGMIPPSKRFYTDQLALAVALARGLPWTPASPELNFATHVDLHGQTVAGLAPRLLHYHSQFDAQGFLLRPRCPLAEAAAERVNRSRAHALGLSYGSLRGRTALERLSNRGQRVKQRLANGMSALLPTMLE
jgi:hypothetical protein